MKTFLRALLLLCFYSNLTAQQPNQGRSIENNGLTGSLFVHDPVMIKAGDTYYVFSTGLNIKSSKNKINWVDEGRVFTRSDSSSYTWWHNNIPDKIGLWAPDIHYANGEYKLYYSISAWMNFNSSIGYATNKTLDKNNADYKWIDHGEVISCKNGGEGVNVIDPNIFIDTAGKEWLLYGSYKAGLRMVQLDVNTGKLLNDKPEIITLTTALGEGSYLIKGPEYYYLFASRGRCCAGNESTYQIIMGRSKKITGPYVNKKGESLIDNKYSVFLAGDYNEPGRGHNGFFAEGDTTYIVYHAYTRSQNGASVLNIKPLYMDAEGWPTIEPTPRLFEMPAFEKRSFIGK